MGVKAPPRRRADWRSLPRRMFTFCSRCRSFAYCAGHRRNTLKCRACYEGPAR